MRIDAVPTFYRGVRFASTLEADWAAMFDTLHWFWQYEPHAVKLLNDEYYRPDFCLPAQRVWCEVKGPHDERLHKPQLLQRTLSYDAWDWESWLVVILRAPGPGDGAIWHGTSDGQDIKLVRCPECNHYSFMDYSGIWICRHHPRVSEEPNKFFYQPGGELLDSGEVKFTRAPRRLKRGA